MKLHKFLPVSFALLLLLCHVPSALAQSEANKALLDAVKADDVAAAQAAIKRGADVNCKDAEDLTPLMLAADKDSASITRMLLENGANVNERGRRGATALIIAALLDDPHVVPLLIRAHADLNAR